MAKPARPVSESYAPVCCSLSHSLSNSSKTGIVVQDDDDDDDEHSPIFSISKSSMDVVMATGPPHERDPAWTRLKIKRSSSTNTHSEPNAVILQQLRVHMRPGVRSTNSPYLAVTPATLDVHGLPRPREPKSPNEQCWSDCSSRRVLGTVVQRGRSSRPTSLTQEVCHPSAPNSPSATPSALQRPSDAGVDFSNSNLPEDFEVDSSPQPTPSLSPLHSSRQQDGRFLEKHLLENKAASDVGHLVDEQSHDSEGPPLLDDTEEESLEPQCCCSQRLPPAESPGSGGNGASVCYLELPQQHEEKNNPGHGVCCRCSHNCTSVTSKSPIVRLFREEGTMTSQNKLVNAEVQTVSPIGSWWDLRRNISTCSMGSHSILGSPPGSRLNLRFSVGSHSNLVSPSSSMFKISSLEEEQRHGEFHQEKKKRSCLKMLDKDDLGRRSSMKQVQWDEDGLTWDIHGASVDPEVLSTAIQRHLELSPDPPLRKSSKKTKAPKPPLTSNVVKAEAPELKADVMINTSFCVMHSEVGQDRGGKEEETPDVPCRVSRAEGENVREEEDEVYTEEGISRLKSHSNESHSQRRSVMRSVSGWCGGCRREKH